MRCSLALWALVMAVCVVKVKDVTCEEGEGSPGERKQRAPSVFTHLQELYRDCFASGSQAPAEECIATKVALGLDGLLHARSIPLMEGVSLDARDSASLPPPLTPEALEAPQSRAAGGHPAALYSLIGDRLLAIGRTHALRLDLSPAVEAAGEARELGMLLKARKVLAPFVVGVVLKLVAFLPLLLTSMGLLALKTLGHSTLAILITGVFGLRRLLGGSDEPSSAEGATGLGSGYQLEKSYGLLNHAPTTFLDYGAASHDLYHAHHATYAAHPAAGYYGRAIRVGNSAARNSRSHHSRSGRTLPASSFISPSPASAA